MAKQQVALKFEPETLAALDARAEREGSSRQALVDFAIKPLIEHDEVRTLELPRSVTQMFDRIARGQGVHRVDVMQRALIDYAGRAAERWQINAKAEERPDLERIASQIREGHGIRPYEGN